jgi:hypothetical protein
MNYGQLKDKEFKELFRKTFPNLRYTNRYGSDIEFTKNDVYYVVEYENSSRGLTSNLARIARRNEGLSQPVVVVMLYTDLHEQKHKGDRLNATFIAQLLLNKMKVHIVRARDIFDWQYILDL